MGILQYEMFGLASIDLACESGVYAFRSRSRRGRVGCLYSGIRVLGTVDRDSDAKGVNNDERPPEAVAAFRQVPLSRQEPGVDKA
jgi:hypothetical protein